jgi:putative transposase
MPNHIHLVARFSTEHLLSDVLRDFKKFTARQVYRHFQAENDERMLAVLQKAGTPVDQEYKVWESGFEARDVFSRKFLEQKMDYIHHNPCQPQWNLVDEPVAYLWSSARFYLADRPCIIPIDEVREYLQE